MKDIEDVATLTRQELIERVELIVARGEEAAYRIGREWSKAKLGLTLRERLERRSTEQLRSIAGGRGGVKSHNSGRCLICSHVEREKIEAALREGISYRTIGKTWGMNKQSVSRHVNHSEGGVAKW